ncbi:hypothetical protein RhiirC2_850346 [Rhizophagus irregularis]|uniref:Crinkler effector protein N-terminal domain-containing protein n=1 Tax=Rhizophagus irregularis TaxID=588596 RepID=A0A2N1N7N6_9GLOM|nr:hypothetical protein RhiirC2_850346 [Rhizophagus irregularis]
MSITLLCFVKGNTLANAFPVDVEKDQLVGRLKKVIKVAKQNKFTSVDADKFRLRKVEISVDRKRSVEQSLLRDKDELLAKRDIGYWTENRLRGIFVKLPLLSLEEALSCIPPPLTYSPKCTTSKTATKVNGSPQTRMLLWGFFRGSESIPLRSITEIQRPRFNDRFVVLNEEVLRNAMNVNI